MTATHRFPHLVARPGGGAPSGTPPRIFFGRLIWFLNQNGGNGGLTEEACSTKSPFTYQVTAQEGASFLQISEAGVCQGATVDVAIK